MLDQCHRGYYIYYIRHVGHINICAFKIALFRGVLKKPHCLIIIGFSGIDFFVLCNLAVTLMEHVACCHFLYVEGFLSDEHEIGKQTNIDVFLELPGVG